MFGKNQARAILLLVTLSATAKAFTRSALKDFLVHSSSNELVSPVEQSPTEVKHRHVFSSFGQCLDVNSEETLCFSRRKLISLILPLATIGAIPMAARATETVGKDPNCNDPGCLGVWDGLLADCPHRKTMGAGCVSSQDDTPGIFAEPWDYSESRMLDWEVQMHVLKTVILLVCSKRGDQVKILIENGRYLRVLFTDGKTGEESIGEFYFTPGDTTVQFRVGSTAGLSLPFLSSLKNLDRCESIRKECHYLKLPVLRNRRRSLFFIESDFDTFGPASAALGPPSEMSTADIEGR